MPIRVTAAGPLGILGIRREAFGKVHSQIDATYHCSTCEFVVDQLNIALLRQGLISSPPGGCPVSLFTRVKVIDAIAN